jgi:ATP-binding cassette subfamily C protein
VLLCLLSAIAGLLEGLGISTAAPMLASMGVEGDKSGPISEVTGTIMGVIGLDSSPIGFGFLLVGLVLLATLFGLVQAWVAVRLQTNYVLSWQDDLMRSYQNSHWSYIRSQSTGDLVGSIVTETGRLGGAYYQSVLLITVGIHLIIYLTIGFLLSPAICLIVLGGGITLFLIARPLLKRASVFGARITKVTLNLQTLLSDQFSAAKVIKAFDSGDAFHKDFQGEAKALRDATAANAFDMQIAKAINDFGSGVLVVTVLLVGYMVLGVSAASMLVVLAIFIRIIPKLSAAQQCLQTISQVLPAFSLVRQMHNQAIAEVEKGGKDKPNLTKPVSIQLNDLTVSYDSEPVLSGLNLDIQSGTFVALVGASGAGKTTLVDVLLGLVKTEEGAVETDGIPLNELDLSHWRHSIGYMSQSVPVITGSIRDNIRFGRNYIDETAIEEAVEQASLKGFINERSGGLETLISAGGNEISGGELQRMGLARALAGKPKLLILDEVSSSLDVESEQAVMGEIKRVKGKMTIIAIAHRLSTIRHADTIHVMADGEIKESGSWEELIAQNGIFRKLHDFQH